MIKQFALLSIALLLGVINHATVRAAPFTANNLVIYRVGDGSAALSTSAAAVFLDEYKVTAGQAIVQSIALPSVATSSGNRALTATGTVTGGGSITSEGLITRSPNGLFLLLTGYNATAGTPAIGASSSNTANASPVARVVGIVPNNGVVDTTTALVNTYDKNNIRSAVTLDGTTLSTAGASGTSNTGALANSDGVRSTTKGATTSTQLNSTQSDDRQVNVFNSQIYFSTAGTSGGIGSRGVYTLGTATAPGTVPTLVADTGSTSSPQAFFFANNLTLYIADDRVTAAGGGIQKYISSDNGSTFALAYRLSPPGPGGARGLTATVSGNNVMLYATTTEAGANKLVTVTDTLSATMTPSPTPTFTILATAPTNEVFRGVAFAPSTATFVTLISFTATRYSSVLWLNWQTGLEVDNLGFNVYREVGGKKTRLNGNDLIAGSAIQTGANSGCNYAWPDALVPGAKYWLEDVDTNGTHTWHGPITPRPGLGSAGAFRRSPVLGQ